MKDEERKDAKKHCTRARVRVGGRFGWKKETMTRIIDRAQQEGTLPIHRVAIDVNDPDKGMARSCSVVWSVSSIQ